MKNYYGVEASFGMCSGKPSLISLLLYTTPVYCQYFLSSIGSPATITRTFTTQKTANEYIDYLYKRYPNSTAPCPQLNADQFSLLIESLLFFALAGFAGAFSLLFPLLNHVFTSNSLCFMQKSVFNS